MKTQNQIPENVMLTNLKQQDTAVHSNIEKEHQVALHS